MGVSVERTPLQFDSVYGSPKKPWQPDHSSNSCTACRVEFTTWTRRRHHCRACGSLVCADCSPSLMPLPHLGYDTPVRVCMGCQPQLSPSSNSFVESSDVPSTVAYTDDDMRDAFDEISNHSRMKLSRYFVKSEAVNWLVDSGCTSTRPAATQVFRRLVIEGMIIQTNDSYMINKDLLGDRRTSTHDFDSMSGKNKCNNCFRSYMARSTPAPGFCSIDCKTNLEFSRSDALRAEALCA